MIVKVAAPDVEETLTFPNEAVTVTVVVSPLARPEITLLPTPSET